jgi:hypothetical protein
MALSAGKLQDSIIALADPTHSSFPGWPATAADAAANWAAAARSYYEDLALHGILLQQTSINAIIDPLYTVALDAGEAAFSATLAAYFSDVVVGQSSKGLDTSFVAFITAYLAVVSPPLAAIPPVLGPLILVAPSGFFGHPGIETALSGFAAPGGFPTNPLPPAAAMATAVDLWTKTGTSQLSTTTPETWK